MDLKISKVEHQDDIQSFTNVILDANTAQRDRNSEIEFTDVFLPGHDTPRGRQEACKVYEDMLHLPNWFFVKITATEAGNEKIIGAAMWKQVNSLSEASAAQLDSSRWGGDESMRMYVQTMLDDSEGRKSMAIQKSGIPALVLVALGVDPKHQSCGAGSQLVRDGIARADAIDAPIVVNANTFARRFYEKLGFEAWEVVTRPQIPEFSHRPRSTYALMVRPKSSEH